MPKPAGCREFRQSLQLNRRGLLQVGALGTLGLTLPQLLELQAHGATASDKSKNSVIILWMRGGPSQFELWDPKPEAPVEIRGEFNPISTNVPGIQLGEHLPLSAAMMDRWSIIRSMHFRKADGEASHSSGDQICFTGYPAGRSVDQNVYPSVGSVVKRQLQKRDPSLPAYVMIPRNVPGTNAGYLGSAWSPLETQADPASGGPFSIPNMGLAEGLSVDRLDGRENLLGGLDRLRRDVDRSGQMETMDGFRQQAWEMITGPKARRAFDLDSEPKSLRERYGSWPAYTPRMVAGGDRPNWPARMLLAARLVEAGVRLVTVDVRWWDTHQDNFWALKNGFLPPWDLAFSALLEDLERRGVLDTTMIVAWGEMGRTPKINKDAGRDHWPQVFSVAMAGGGIRGGRIVGSSDKHASVPKDNPKIVQDVLATLYRHLGVNTGTQYVDLAGRPHPVLPCGRPIDELF